MAKDGTVRGGRRQGAGAKPKSQRDRILDGDVAKRLPDPVKLTGTPLVGSEMPDVDAWLESKQQNGKGWNAKDLAIKTVAWLKGRGCDQYVTMQQVYAFAVPQARWIQCQEAISEFGLLGINSAGAADVSPFVKMSDIFYKQAASAWFAISQVAKEHGMPDVPAGDEMMSSLLAD